MRWLLTRHAPVFAQALRALGQEVVDNPEVTVDHYTDPSEQDSTMRDYPLRRVIERTSPDVVVLVDLLVRRREAGDKLWWGYPRSTVAMIARRRARHPVLVGFARRDPGVWNAYRSGIKACYARIGDCAVYLSTKSGITRLARHHIRAATWAPGLSLDPLIQGVENFRAGEIYRPGGR